jgi:hypothetical protein
MRTHGWVVLVRCSFLAFVGQRSRRHSDVLERGRRHRVQSPSRTHTTQHEYSCTAVFRILYVPWLVGSSLLVFTATASCSSTVLPIFSLNVPLSRFACQSCGRRRALRRCESSNLLLLEYAKTDSNLHQQPAEQRNNTNAQQLTTHSPQPVSFITHSSYSCTAVHWPNTPSRVHTNSKIKRQQPLAGEAKPQQ